VAFAKHSAVAQLGSSNNNGNANQIIFLLKQMKPSCERIRVVALERPVRLSQILLLAMLTS